MTKQGWDPNGFDYLITNGDGHARVAARILPERPDSTTFRWYVFRDEQHSAASGAESTQEAARQAVEEVLAARTMHPSSRPGTRKTGSNPSRMS